MQSCYVDYTTRAIADLVDYYGLGMVITRLNVPVKERGKGAGSKLLAQILADADRTHTTLFLEVVPTGGLNEEQLTAWYKKHGFSNWKGIMRRRPRWRTMQENPIFGKKRHKYPVGSEVVVGLGVEGQIGDVRKVEQVPVSTLPEKSHLYDFVYTIAFSRPTGVFFSKHWEDELDRVWYRPRFHQGQTITAWVGGPYKGMIENVWWDKVQQWWTYNVSVALPPDPGYKEKSILLSEPEHILIGLAEKEKKL